MVIKKNKRLDNSYYNGFYNNGQKHGHGHYKWNDGSEYIGNWFNNQLNGNVY